METLNNNQQATGLQTYLNENIGVNIRVKMINGEPWFSGKDVCYSIGISKYWKSHSTLTLLATQNYPFLLKYDCPLWLK